MCHSLRFCHNNQSQAVWLGSPISELEVILVFSCTGSLAQLRSREKIFFGKKLGFAIKINHRQFGSVRLTNNSARSDFSLQPILVAYHSRGSGKKNLFFKKLGFAIKINHGQFGQVRLSNTRDIGHLRLHQATQASRPPLYRNFDIFTVVTYMPNQVPLRSQKPREFFGAKKNFGKIVVISALPTQAALAGNSLIEKVEIPPKSSTVEQFQGHFVFSNF